MDLISEVLPEYLNRLSPQQWRDLSKGTRWLDSESAMLFTDFVMEAMQSISTTNLLTIHNSHQMMVKKKPVGDATSKQSLIANINNDTSKYMYTFSTDCKYTEGSDLDMRSVYIGRSLLDFSLLHRLVIEIYASLRERNWIAECIGLEDLRNPQLDTKAKRDLVKSKIICNARAKPTELPPLVVFPVVSSQQLENLLSSHKFVARVTGAVRDILTQQSGKVTLGGNILLYSLLPLPSNPGLKAHAAASDVVNQIVGDLRRDSEASQATGMLQFNTTKVQTRLIIFFLAHFSREYIGRMLVKLYYCLKPTEESDCEGASSSSSSAVNFSSGADGNLSLTRPDSELAGMPNMCGILKKMRWSQQMEAPVTSPESMAALTEQVDTLLEEHLLQQGTYNGHPCAFVRVGRSITNCKDLLVKGFMDAINNHMTDPAGKNLLAHDRGESQRSRVVQTVIEDEVRCLLQHSLIWLRMWKWKHYNNKRDVVSHTLRDIENTFTSILAQDNVRAMQVGVRTLVAMVVLHFKRYCSYPWQACDYKRVINRLSEKLLKEISLTDVSLHTSDMNKIHVGVFKELCKTYSGANGARLVMSANHPDIDRGIIATFKRHMQRPKQAAFWTLLRSLLESLKKQFTASFMCNCHHEALELDLGKADTPTEPPPIPSVPQS